MRLLRILSRPGRALNQNGEPEAPTFYRPRAPPHKEERGKQ